jgi:hypothetical protein
MDVSPRSIFECAAICLADRFAAGVTHGESLLGHIRDVSSVTVNVPNGVHVHQNQPTDGDIPHA